VIDRESTFSALRGKQAYIGLGAALIAAAFEEVDGTHDGRFRPQGDRSDSRSGRRVASAALCWCRWVIAEPEGDWLVDAEKSATFRGTVRHRNELMNALEQHLTQYAAYHRDLTQHSDPFHRYSDDCGRDPEFLARPALNAG
jgi:hypothetical protein